LLWSRARRDRRSFDYIVFEHGLHRLDERRSLLLVLRRPKKSSERMENAAHRGLGRASLTRCTMKHGEGFVESFSMRRFRIQNAGSARLGFPSVERRLAAGSSRRPSTLRQDGRSRQRTPHPGRRDVVSVRLSSFIPEVHERNRKAAATRKATRKNERFEPAEGAGQGFVAQSCRHGVRFNGREGTRFDSSAQRRR
jgi:hypothetical protein